MKLLSYPASTLPSAALPQASHHGVAGPREISPRPGDLKKARFYKPELDVLRAFAFLLVLNSHILPSGNSFSFLGALSQCGAAGVCLFFTLSAFLITELLLREHEATGTIHIQAFYIRRILRIWPLYFLVLVLGMLVPPLLHRSPQVLPVLLPYLLFCGNWAIVLHGSWFANPLVMPLWSISVEEQFYIVWPALVRRWSRPGILLAACLVFPLGWATDFLVPHLHLVRDPILWANSLSQFQFFGLGALLALANHRRSFALTALQRWLALLASTVFFFLAAYPFHFNDQAPGITGLQVLSGYLSLDAACALLFCAILNLKLPIVARPFIYLGKISYGLYVFHFMFTVVAHDLFVKYLHLSLYTALSANYITTLTGTILVASLSYRFYEKPFLAYKHRFTFIPSRKV